MLFDRKTVLMQVARETPGVYAWASVRALWANVQESGKQNIFSRLGVGARTVVFTLPRAEGISPHDALHMQGRFFLVTQAIKTGLLTEVTTAEVPISICTAFRPRETVGLCKRPVFTQEQVAVFPAVRTMRYQKYTQEEPMARVEQTCVLVTPKEIRLREGDVVETEGARYAVWLCGELEPYRNEYEVYAVQDVRLEARQDAGA